MLNFREIGTKKTVVGLGLGQFLSLLITSTGFSSSELARRGKMVLLCNPGNSGCRGQLSWGSNPRKGDSLVIAGATLYAVSNVSEEFLVKNADRIELMSLLGFFGAIISAIQISILERNELKSIHWSAGAALPFVGFALAMFLFYSFVPVLLKISGSTMLNLSLLTSDMWSVLIRIFAYHDKVDWMYYVAFAAVAVGLVIYSGGDKEEQNRADVADEEAEQSKHFDEESGSGSRSQGTLAGSSKTGDSSNQDPATTGIREKHENENKNVGKMH
ncbi:hypothetical protein GH714_008955 [Hevea brasiliensis]|uniref:EamA domain-containing protein n=1 Tax=Hevea brasiliensis TaxID=3981 RepID=A0A6A6NCB7_HEVBR|nr:hypothetical protein GH714_008955 [Hevea brasiliensis]